VTGPVLGTRGVAAREAIARLCAADLPPLELLEQVARRIRSVVPYAAAGWLLTDPATLLHTGAFSEAVPPALHLRLIDNELVDSDVAKFGEIARRRRPVLRLSDAAAGDLSRSARHRRLYAPAGYGGELRAAFRTRDACWAVACLTRRADEPDFDDEDVAFIAAICDDVGHGLRTGLLISGATFAPAAAAAPGMLLVGDDGALESMSADAERWLAELPGDGLALPAVVHEVVARARTRAGDGQSGPPARARVRSASGGWMLVHGARLRRPGGAARQTAVVLEPAGRADLAPLIAALHDLTEREAEVAQLLVSGMPVAAIARTLWISTYTLRDHVKAIYAKVGVRSRAELTALLFHEHYLPHLRIASRP